MNNLHAELCANLTPNLSASMDGTIGRGVKSADIVNGNLVLTFTDGKTLNLGPVVGSNGEDGYSPSTSITNIPGGHRVTITDADGDHAFDVMDGTTGPQGPKGDTGSPGPAGPAGPKGDTGATGADGQDGHSPVVQAVRHSQAPITAILVDGVQQAIIRDGATGPRGPKGPQGDAFTYEDFTPEQLAALKGPKGDKGDTGAQGPKGDTGDTGPAGADGAAGQSAYAAAQAGGYTDTQANFYTDLAAMQGLASALAAI